MFDRDFLLKLKKDSNSKMNLANLYRSTHMNSTHSKNRHFGCLSGHHMRRHVANMCHGWSIGVGDWVVAQEAFNVVIKWFYSFPDLKFHVQIQALSFPENIIEVQYFSCCVFFYIIIIAFTKLSISDKYNTCQFSIFQFDMKQSLNKYLNVIETFMIC